jgi:hypothetical protein
MSTTTTTTTTEDARYCECGTRMTRKAGIAARNGKAWAGFFCAGGQCAPQWAEIDPIIKAALDAWVDAGRVR